MLSLSFASSRGIATSGGSGDAVGSATGGAEGGAGVGVAFVAPNAAGESANPAVRAKSRHGERAGSKTSVANQKSNHVCAVALARIALVKFRNDLEEVPDDEQVGELADGDASILIDGNDGTGRPHSNFMLNRAGNSGRDVELGADRLAGLTNLVTVPDPAGVNRRAGRAHGAAQRIGQSLRIVLKGSGPPRPRPPETTIEASSTPSSAAASTTSSSTRIA